MNSVHSRTPTPENDEIHIRFVPCTVNRSLIRTITHGSNLGSEYLFLDEPFSIPFCCKDLSWRLPHTTGIRE